EVVGRDVHANTRSFGAFVSGRQPPSSTTTVSSIRTPPCPGRYTPGSTVTTWPEASVSVDADDTRGASWISRPTPWPVPCTNESAHPAPAITVRQASSTVLPATPAATAATPARWLSATTSTLRPALSGGSPTANVRVMSEQ